MCISQSNNRQGTIDVAGAKYGKPEGLHLNVFGMVNYRPGGSPSLRRQQQRSQVRACRMYVGGMSHLSDHNHGTLISARTQIHRLLPEIPQQGRRPIIIRAAHEARPAETLVESTLVIALEAGAGDRSYRRRVLWRDWPSRVRHTDVARVAEGQVD